MFTPGKRSPGAKERLGAGVRRAGAGGSPTSRSQRSKEMKSAEVPIAKIARITGLSRPTIYRVLSHLTHDVGRH